MNKLNNKGFTLIEILAVVVILAILGLISIPNVLNTINNSTNTTYNILVKNISIAARELYEELDNINTTLYHYNKDGNTGIKIEISKDKNGNKIEDNTLKINLQTLVSNGLLTGKNNTNKNELNKNDKIITNPKTKEDIGECEIIIKKHVDKNFNTSYQIKNNSTNTSCPTDSEYINALN